MINILNYMITAMWKIFVFLLLVFLVYIFISAIIDDILTKILKAKYKKNEEKIVNEYFKNDKDKAE